VTLTLRTLLAYLDDTLPPAEAAEIGRKLADNPATQKLAERIRAAVRRRSLAAAGTDPNIVAEYLSDALSSDAVRQFEATCLEDDAALADVAACHQVLSLVASEQVRVPPTARSRMYALVKGRESVPGRKPAAALSVAAVREAAPADDADQDAHLLLGLPAYSADESAGRRLARAGGVAGLALGLLVCGYMAWPAADAGGEPNRPARVVAGLLPPAPAATPATAPAPAPAAEEKPPVVELLPDPPAAPAGPTPANPDRVPLGELVAAPGAGLVVARPADGGDPQRLAAGPGEVIATDRLVCLPGNKAALALDSGAKLDLWGNLPELVPLPVFETAVTLAVPPDGFHADLRLHAGRVYLSGRQPAGVKVRLRVADQVWDVALPDDKAEAVVQLVHRPTPGEQPAPPAQEVVLYSLAGKLTVTPAGGTDIPVERSAGLAWTSAGGPPNPVPALDPAGRAAFARLNPVPASAQALNAVLTDLSKRPPTGPVSAPFDELVQAVPEGRTLPPAMRAGYAVGVYGLAALGRADRLADLLATPVNPLLRKLTADALVSALAADPDLVGPVRALLVEQRKLTPAEADEAFRLLRGLSPAEQTDPATVDRLLADLQSPALPVRELALSGLFALTPPDEVGKLNAPPFVYDVAAPADERERGEAAWKRRGEEMKRRMEMAPKPAPPGQP
jgi:hypothetical protein